MIETNRTDALSYRELLPCTEHSVDVGLHHDCSVHTDSGISDSAKDG
jgi:hypothetical protein